MKINRNREEILAEAIRLMEGTAAQAEFRASQSIEAAARAYEETALVIRCDTSRLRRYAAGEAEDGSTVFDTSRTKASETTLSEANSGRGARG